MAQMLARDLSIQISEANKAGTGCCKCTVCTSSKGKGAAYGTQTAEYQADLAEVRAALDRELATP